MFGVIGPRWGSTPPDESGLVNEASECRNGHDLISQMTVGGFGGGVVVRGYGHIRHGGNGTVFVSSNIKAGTESQWAQMKCPLLGGALMKVGKTNSTSAPVSASDQENRWSDLGLVGQRVSPVGGAVRPSRHCLIK